LAREHGFAHYDVEERPHGWPHPELEKVFVSDRTAFVAQLCKHHQLVAINWGFPVSLISWVKELQACGVKLIWFDGDVARARDAFRHRGNEKGPIENFDRQVAAIKNAGFPASLNCVIVPALSTSGIFLDQHQIERLVFP